MGQFGKQIFKTRSIRINKMKFSNQKKGIIVLAVFFFIFLANPNDAFAAARFWVGGTGNWDASDTTHWASTSGGAGGASVPGSGDTVTFDGSSGGGTVTVTATVTVTSITMGAFTGTLDLNGQTINVSTFSLTGTGTRTLTMGSSAINLSGGGTTWNATTLTNSTISANTATITMSGAGASFTSAGNINWNGLSLVFSGSGQATLSADANTFANVTRTGTAVKTDFFVVPRMTVTGTLTLAGDSSVNRILVTSNTLGTARTITNTGATMTWSNVDFMDVDLSTAYDCSGITGGCGDAGGNTDITFTTGQINYWVGGAGNWSDVNEWASSSGGSAGTGRVPLPQDDVVFDNGSFNGASQTVDTNGMPRLGKSVDWSAYTEAQSPNWAIDSTTLQASFYGSLNIANGGTSVIGTLAWGSQLLFRGRGSFSLTTGGEIFGGAVQFLAPTGTYTLGDAFSTVGAITFANGSFDANDFNVTASSVTVNSTFSTFSMGSGTWTVTGTGTAWSMAASGVTVNEETSTIIVSSTTATAKTFAGNGQTYYNLQITGSNVTLTGSNTFNNLALNNAGRIGTKFTRATTQTLTTFEANGSGGSLVYASSTAATNATLTKSGGGTICEDYLYITDLTGSPVSTWYAGANSTDGGDNTNWTFTACPGGDPNSSSRQYGIPNEKVRGGTKVRGGVKFR